MTNTTYTPWRETEWPRLDREITAVHWQGGKLQIDIAQSHAQAPSIMIRFDIERAFQGIDEGYRLRDIPLGKALIYCTTGSPYLKAFRANAAATMDNFPLRHWIIVSANQCVDVLSENEPLVVASALTPNTSLERTREG
jgi:hypothetical protein